MTKTSSFLLCSTLLAGCLAVAQNPGRQPNPANRVQHQVDFATAVLGLNATQQQQATTIFTTEETTTSGERNSEQTARKSLQQAIASNDSAGISSASTTLGNLGSESIAARATAEAAFEQILTPSQLAIWKKVGHVRGEGFGFGPPPPGPGR